MSQLDVVNFLARLGEVSLHLLGSNNVDKSPANVETALGWITETLIQCIDLVVKSEAMQRLV